MKHQKVYTTTIKNGVKEERKDSYFEELAFTQTEVEKRVHVTNATVLQELLTCLELITKEKTPKVIITIKANDGNVELLIKRWVKERIQLPRNK